MFLKTIICILAFSVASCAIFKPSLNENSIFIDQGIRVGPGSTIEPSGSDVERLRPDLYYNAHTNTLQVNPELADEAREFFNVTVSSTGVWTFTLKAIEIRVVPLFVIPHTPIRPSPEEGPDKLGDFVWKADCRCVTVDTPGGCDGYDPKEGPSWKWSDGQPRSYGVCSTSEKRGCLEIVSFLGKQDTYSRPGCNKEDFDGSKDVRAWVCLEL